MVFVRTGKLKSDGRPVMQVIDPTPEKRIVFVAADTTSLVSKPAEVIAAPPERDALRWVQARVVDVFVDHHSTCAKWLARQRKGSNRDSEHAL